MAKAEYEQILEQTGFEGISVEITNVYDPKTMGRLSGPEEIEALRKVHATNAFVRARKPIYSGLRCCLTHR